MQSNSHQKQHRLNSFSLRETKDMNALYIDSNIYLNLFLEEVNPKTCLEL